MDILKKDIINSFDSNNILNYDLYNKSNKLYENIKISEINNLNNNTSNIYNIIIQY